jgi:hypothetical protein
MRAESTSRPKVLRWVIPAGLGLACLVTLFFFDPARYSFYPRCIFHQTTGLLCPGCGGLRAVHQLLHGHLMGAFALNPFFVISLPVIFAYCAICAVRILRNGTIQFRLSPRWLWIFFACTLVFGVWRNLPGVPFGATPP